MLKINRFTCTAEQRRIEDQFLTEGHDLFVKLVHLGIDAHYAANVDLPHVNEDGERVVHGARRHVQYVSGCYLGAARALVSGMQREPNRGENYFPYMVLRAFNYGNVDGWMKRLIDKNGGVIPTTWSNSDLTYD
jgi:hypothetical protein